jgi:uncharacterized protein (TIGR03083 family)
MSQPVPEVLRLDCDAVTALCSELSEREFELPTVCVPWDVKELLAHMLRALRRIPVALDTDPSGADTDAVGYFTAYDPIGDAPVIADHAVKIATEFATGAALVEDFERLASECLRSTADEPPDRKIELPWGPRMRLDEFLKTRVLEIVVHGIDLTDALGVAPVATDAGLGVVTETLNGLLGSPPITDFAWSAADYIRKATGRSELTEAERMQLGARTDAFSMLR